LTLELYSFAKNKAVTLQKAKLMPIAEPLSASSPAIL
jgi:hypothetical protein